MSPSMSKNIQAQGLSSSLRIDEETKLVQKQGIVTILSSDCERNRAAAATSLRRTLSADMSSKKWLSQNGFSPMKKIASSEELSHSEIIVATDSSSSSEGEDDYEERKDLDAEGGGRGQFDIWSSIQRDKKKLEHEKPGEFDTWSSIISQKANEDASKSAPPPYIHPLVKRSQSSLSEKSLEICTESLGSETGSDVYSSYPPSETGDAEEDKEEEKETLLLASSEAEEDLPVPKYNYSSAATKKVPPRSFPPPLPSLSRRDGPSLHMRFHRHNGRLVLEAVSVPSLNNFCARRQDGRLLLTFNNHPNDEGSQEEDAEELEEEYDVEELEEEFGGFEEDDQEEKEDEEDETEEEETVIEQPSILSSGIKSVHRLAITMNKPIGFVNRNPKWSDKLNEVVNFEDVKVAETTPVAKSLPPRPRVTPRLVPSAPAVASAAAASASASFNAYEYYWRSKSTAKAAAPVPPNPLTHQQNNSPLKNNSSKLIVFGEINQTPTEQQQLLVLRGKNGDYLVHNLKSCKESRRSFLFWEPHCIATS